MPIISSLFGLASLYLALLAKYLRPQRGRVIVLAGIFLTGIGLQIISPQIVRYFIDTAQEQGSLGRLYVAGFVFLAVGSITQVVRAAHWILSADVAWRATNRMRSDLLSHLLRLEMDFHNNHTPGELIERIDTDIQRLNNFFSQFFLRMVRGILLSIGVLAVLWWEDWRIGLAVAAFIISYLIVHTLGQRITVAYWRAERQASAELFGFLGERLSAIKDIQTSGAGGYVLRRFHAVMRTVFRAVLKAEMVAAGGWTVSNSLFAVSFAASMALGAYLFRGDVITIGTVYLIIHYLHELQAPLITVSREMEDVQRARVSIERVNELFNTRPAIRDGSGSSIPSGKLSVEFSDVSFAYHQDNWVLRNVSFRLEPGRLLGLLGRTGSGKTTLSRLLFRLYDAGHGTIRLGGVDTTEPRIAELRDRVGMVTQEVQLFEGSVRDNITLFDADIADAQILDSLHGLGLDEWYGSLPDGLDTRLAAGGAQLSAGEAQLLAFVRVFLKDPGVLARIHRRTPMDGVRTAEGGG